MGIKPVKNQSRMPAGLNDRTEQIKTPATQNQGFPVSTVQEVTNDGGEAPVALPSRKNRLSPDR